MPVKKPKIFQWTDRSSGLVDIGRRITLPPRPRITLPPKIQDEDNDPETTQRDGFLDGIGRTIRCWFGKHRKSIGAVGEEKDDEPCAGDGSDPVGPDEDSRLPAMPIRRHRLRLSSDGLSIGAFSLRWIDIGEISSSDNVIEIYVVPVRQNPDGCTIMRHMKTTYSLEVPSGRMPEIESAIRQFMKRWKPPLRGPFSVKK